MENTKDKCFIMMPISDQGDYPEGHFDKVYEQIISPAVREAGYEPYRVDENKICDSIIGKIFEAIHECPMAICDLSNRNPNVLYELGLRQAYDKPVVLIQDEKTERIFDVSGISTVSYKSTRIYEEVIEARKEIKEAILATQKGEKKTLVKVVKAGKADYDSVSVSQDDRTQIMFEQILNKLTDLFEKNNKVREEEMKQIERERLQIKWKERSRDLRRRWKNEITGDKVNFENLEKLLKGTQILQEELDNFYWLDRAKKKVMQQEMIFTEQEIRNYLFLQRQQPSDTVDTE